MIFPMSNQTESFHTFYGNLLAIYKTSQLRFASRVAAGYSFSILIVSSTSAGLDEVVEKALTLCLASLRARDTRDARSV
jgi:hypothetical protein